MIENVLERDDYVVPGPDQEGTLRLGGQSHSKERDNILPTCNRRQHQDAFGLTQVAGLKIDFHADFTSSLSPWGSANDLFRVEVLTVSLKEEQMHLVQMGSQRAHQQLGPFSGPSLSDIKQPTFV